MEKLIKQFLNGYGYGYGNGDGNGDGYGNGNGYGYGDGDGYGNGDGNGDGYGNGNGYGYGDGNGNGNGYGYGNGNGYGYGDGDGYGNGNGDGYGVKLKTYRGNKVYYIDGIPCIFKSVNKECIFAKVAVINIKHLSSELQFVFKFNGYFAHGHTLKQAKIDAENKYYSTLDISERIASFYKSFQPGKLYPAILLYEWHTTLTGSCQSGKQHWIKQTGFDLKSKITVEQFISLTKNSYGGEIIKQLS